MCLCYVSLQCKESKFNATLIFCHVQEQNLCVRINLIFILTVFSVLMRLFERFLYQII